jgi:hypothetical protein
MLSGLMINYVKIKNILFDNIQEQRIVWKISSQIHVLKNNTVLQIN